MRKGRLRPSVGLCLAKAVRLSHAEAQRLENEVLVDPHAVAARATLIGYYYVRGKFQSAADNRLRHLLWFIQHSPASLILTIREGWHDLDEAQYHILDHAWLDTLDAHLSDSVVLINAARYFAVRDRDAAEELLEKALALCPTDRRVKKELARLRCPPTGASMWPLRLLLMLLPVVLFLELWQRVSGHGTARS